MNTIAHDLERLKFSSSSFSSSSFLPVPLSSVTVLARCMGVELEYDLPVELVPPVGNTGGKSSEGGLVRSIVDTVTFSFSGAAFGFHVRGVVRWVEKFSQGRLTVGGPLDRHYNGYHQCFGIVRKDGTPTPMLGWMGVSKPNDNMRGRWCIHLTGVGCAELLPFSWIYLSEDLRSYSGKITRIDLAVDDLEGVHDLNEARRFYYLGFFNCNGRNPNISQYINSGDRGDTVYIGSRDSGKMIRVYEKGKQLGDKESRWCRWEVEFLAKSRLIPLDILYRRDEYFKGSYEKALFWIDGAATTIKTGYEKSRILFAQAVENAKRQVGRIVSYAVEVLGKSADEVVSLIRGRSGIYPDRLYSPGLEYEGVTNESFCS